MTVKIGLTGSIGMGKTTTAGLFAEEGIPVWDADDAVHRLYARGGAAVEPIRSAFPDAILDGEVSRDRLRALIAKDPETLTRIEQIVHPLVARDRADFLDRHPTGIVVFDIPLLFETGADAWLDLVVVVTAPAEVQKARVMARPGMTEDQFRAITDRQMPDAEKRARADVVLQTLTLDAARDGVRNILETIRGNIGDA